MRASSQDIKEAIIKGYVQGLSNAKDSLAAAKSYLEDKLSCERIIGDYVSRCFSFF